MKIRWNRDVRLNLVDERDGGDRIENFDAGEETDVVFEEIYTNSIDLGFRGGEMCYAVPKYWFTVI